MTKSLKTLLTQIINSLSGTHGSYAPSVTATASGLSVTNILGYYAVRGKVLYISVRCQLTAVPTTNSLLRISLPSGYTAKTNVGSVGGCGSCHFNSNSQLQVSPRIDAGMDYIYIQCGAGGYSFPAIPADWLMLNAQIPI